MIFHRNIPIKQLKEELVIKTSVVNLWKLGLKRIEHLCRLTKSYVQILRRLKNEQEAKELLFQVQRAARFSHYWFALVLSHLIPCPWIGCLCRSYFVPFIPIPLCCLFPQCSSPCLILHF